jgi:hypothetical protein
MTNLILNTALTLVGLSLMPALALPGQGEVDVDVPRAVSQAVKSLLGMQEGKDQAEWPYEGVYRVKPYENDYKGRRQIPIGYRVGGTSIVASALVLAPGFDDDAEREAAVERAALFVCESIAHPLMDPDYSGGYDVRGWGYIYALDFLLLLERRECVPKDLKRKHRKAVVYYLDALGKIEIPKSGGWSYSRRGSLSEVSATSPFMTGPAVQALIAADAQGHRVQSGMIDRALLALERSRATSGEVLYSSNYKQEAIGRQLPGSVGRMLVTENSLYLGGRGSISGVRGALDSFLVHWEWLDKRRAQTGTHVAPYGVAPYYFYFAHFQAAQAIELLPEEMRAEYRRRLNERLFSVRQEGGTWNDRVFERTANYGTSISLRILTMPSAEPTVRRKD